MAKHILVVEDDQEIRETLGEILEDNGYEVTLASNGAHALLELVRVRPTAILLDLMMPVMDGWALRARLEADGALRDIPIVVVSADGNVRDKAAAVGARAFLRKPIRIEDLLQILDDI